MAERMREVVGKHSTWYQCDEHGWDFTNVEEDVCPVCKGESLKVAQLLKALDSRDVRRHLGVTNIQGLKKLIQEGK